MEPTNTIEQVESERERNSQALEMLIADIRDDANSTEREEKLASAIIALRNS